jgi:hypothetical protein
MRVTRAWHAHHPRFPRGDRPPTGSSGCPEVSPPTAIRRLALPRPSGGWPSRGHPEAGPPAAFPHAACFRDSACVFAVLPPQPLKRPIIRGFNQLFSDGVIADIIPLLAVIVRASQARVPFVMLPSPVIIRRSFVKACFPEPHPVFERNIQMIRCTEEVNMVRHDHVKSNQPGI